MRIVGRIILMVGCSEQLALLRYDMGAPRTLLLALALVVKQQTLVYLPVPLGYQWLHMAATCVMFLHLLAAVSPLPGATTGEPRLCLFGLTPKDALRYAQPVLALGVALWLARGAVLWGLHPWFRFGFLPLPWSMGTGALPRWLVRVAPVSAWLVPLLSAASLAAFNWLDALPEAATPEDELVFHEAGQV